MGPVEKLRPEADYTVLDVITKGGRMKKPQSLICSSPPRMCEHVTNLPNEEDERRRKRVRRKSRGIRGTEEMEEEREEKRNVE